MWDTVNDSKNLLGVYHISLSIDSTAVFSKCYEKLSYTADGSGILDYLLGERYGGEGTLSTLFKRKGNLLDFYNGDGIVTDDNPESVSYHKLTIDAKDFFR